MSASKAAKAAGIERGTTQIAETIGKTRPCVDAWFKSNPPLFQACLDFTVKTQRFDYCLRAEKYLAKKAVSAGPDVKISGEPVGAACQLVFSIGDIADSSYVRRSRIPLGASYAEDVAKFWELIKRDLEL